MSVNLSGRRSPTQARATRPLPDERGLPAAAAAAAAALSCCRCRHVPDPITAFAPAIGACAEGGGEDGRRGNSTAAEHVHGADPDAIADAPAGPLVLDCASAATLKNDSDCRIKQTQRHMSSGSVRRRCYYEVLGVPRDVDGDALKKQ